LNLEPGIWNLPMNRFIREHYEPVLEHYQRIRADLMAVLSDEELAFKPGGENMTLGELCREMGETQQSYIESFRTGRCDFRYGQSDPALAHSVTALQAWYATLDAELKAAVAALSDDEVEVPRIDRGGGFMASARLQIYIYQEALLIFYGKAAVYLKAMRKPRPPQMASWIA
jgi:hypothetical protein